MKKGKFINSRLGYVNGDWELCYQGYRYSVQGNF